jgi:hypothetical protein
LLSTGFGNANSSTRAREALALWAAHVTRCVDAFTIIARPVEMADNRELEAA